MFKLFSNSITFRYNCITSFTKSFSTSSFLCEKQSNNRNPFHILDHIGKYEEKLPKKTKEMTVRHRDHATNKNIYGPLIETTMERNKRHQIEQKTGSTSTASVEAICKSKKDIKFESKEYENFAMMYTDHSKKSKECIDSLICNQLTKAKLQKSRILKSKQPKTRRGLPKIIKDPPKITKSNSLEKISKLANRKSSRSSIIRIKESLKYPDSPQEVNLRYIQEFPLYIDEEDKLPVIENSVKSIVSIPHTKTDKKNYPSVSKILQETMSEKSKRALEIWAEKMKSIMSEEEFQKYKQEMFDEGTLLHRCIESSLRGKDEPSSYDINKIAGYWDSVSDVLEKIKDEGEIKAIESRIVHPYLHYVGVIDCIAQYKGIPVLIEWKTSSRLKRKASDTYDNPLQLAAYLGAMQYDPNYSHLPHVQSCLLVMNYSFGENCDVLYFNSSEMLKHWEMWKRRLTLYWKLNSWDSVDAS